MYARGSADRRSAFTSAVIAIQGENEFLYAHKALLDDSPVIREELKNSVGFSRTLQCYDSHKTVNMFLEFLYTGRYTLPPVRSSSHTVPPVPARRQSGVYKSEVSHPVNVPLKPFSAFQNKDMEDLRAPIEGPRCDPAAIMSHARIATLAQKTGVLTLCQHARENLAESLSLLDREGCQRLAGDLGDLLGLVYDEITIWHGAQIEREKMRETVVIFAAWNLEAIMLAGSKRFNTRLEHGGKLVSDIMRLTTRRIIFPKPASETYTPPSEPEQPEEPELEEEYKTQIVEPEPEPVPEPVVEAPKPQVIEETKPVVDVTQVDVTQFLEPETPQNEPEPSLSEKVPEQVVSPTEAPESVKEDDEPTPVAQTFPQPLPTPDPEDKFEHSLKKESETPTLADEYPTPPTVFAKDGWVEDPQNNPISLDNKPEEKIPASWQQEAESIIEVDDDEKRTAGFVDSGFTTTPQPTIPSSTPPPQSFTPPTGPRSMTPGTVTPPSITSINGMPIPTGPKNATKKKKKAKKVPPPPPYAQSPPFAFHRPVLLPSRIAGAIY